MRTLLLAAAVLALLPASAWSQTAATVGKHTITRAQVEERMRPALIEIENTRYEALREGLDDLIAEALFGQEASARGITVEELEKTEIEDKVELPTAEEVQALYDANREQLGGAPFEDMQPRLMAFLAQQSANERRQEVVAKLRKKYPVSIALRPPVVEVGTGDRPLRGGKDAPVTIVMFSDYECPFCRRAEPTVRKVLDTYGDNVRLAYRDFPLDFHQNARPAAAAARCANEQGKFWEYHDKLVENEDLSRSVLERIAGEVELDREKFVACLAEDKHEAAINRDVADASSVGINGTPSFFVNGRLLDGAQPFERFAEIIDEELAWAKSSK